MVLLLGLVLAVSMSQAKPSVPGRVGHQHDKPAAANRLMLLTRIGCADSVTMRKNLEAVLNGRKSWSYVVVDLDKLPKTDVRRRYPTPTLLRGGKDVFGMRLPASASASPG